MQMRTIRIISALASVTARFGLRTRGLNEDGEERGVTEGKRDAQPPRIRDGCRTLFFLVNIGRAVNFVVGIT